MHLPKKRLAGILIPAFSLRREGDLGIGDTLALREWIDWAAEYQVGFLQLLPIHESGMEESPYSAISSVALDPIYLAFDHSMISWLEMADISNARDQLKTALQSPLINYPAVRCAKIKLLGIAWSKFAYAEKSAIDEFDQFRKVESEWLDDYCLFRFLMELNGESKTWNQWPESCSNPERAREFLAHERAQDLNKVDDRLGFFAFVQWLCFQQWNAVRAHADRRRVKLMGDVPIGISWHSCDVFFNRNEFHLDWCGGSPPEGMGQDDPFFQQWGQNWGIPLYRWDHMQADGFTWWRKRIERLTKIFHMFRIDHILGFYRIYAFPWLPDRNDEFIGLSHDEAAAINGGRLPRWFLRPDDTVENKVANRADGDLRLCAIMQAAKGSEVIAEDLGWVPDYVRPNLADLGIAGFKIPHWDSNEHGHPTPGSAFPENSFAAYSTHDHEPINATWKSCLRIIQQNEGHPNEQTKWAVGGAVNTLRILSEFAGIPISSESSWPAYTEGIQLRLIKSILASNSRYAVLMVTELFNLDDQINHPGTMNGENWRFRLPWTLAEIRAEPRLEDACEKLANLISITHRA